MTLAKKILFFTNSDYGQANVFLATLHVLIQTTAASDISLHVASTAELEPAVQAMAAYATQTSRTATPNTVAFHVMAGTSNRRAAERPGVGMVEAYDLRPGLVNSARNVLAIPGILLPWEPAEFAALYKETARVVAAVRPDLIVVEPLWTPGLTLCHHLAETEGLRWLVLSPNTIKDFAVPVQPWLAMLWKYPLVMSALPYPLPLTAVPRNVALNLVAGYMLLTDRRLAATAAHLQAATGLTGLRLLTANDLGVLRAPPPGLRVLAANAAALDYHFAVLPRHVVPVGPVVRAAPPVAQVDAPLAAWLARAPTVYVSLGTHLAATAAEAAEMARALRHVLDADPKAAMQALWKLRRKRGAVVVGDEGRDEGWDGEWAEVRDVLGRLIDEDRVRVTSWVGAEPKSVLESGAIVCSVNHGGASSFNEALCAGVPQVCLPPWADCYDYANRVEMLGIGLWANKKAKPRWTADELGHALAAVVLPGEQSDEMRRRARDLAAKFGEADGRETAAREILKALD